MKTSGVVELVPRDSYLSRIGRVKLAGYETCSDLTAVDYLEATNRIIPSDIDGNSINAERFEVVVNLLSLSKLERVRVRVQVPESDPTLASLFDIYPGVEAMEREVFDLFGITFIDHPDLTRILMPEDWEGHPLRKDYSVGRIPVQFKEVRSMR